MKRHRSRKERGSIVRRRRADGSYAYAAVYRANGKQLWATFATRAAATEYLVAQLGQVHKGIHVTPTPAPMGQVLDHWLSDEVKTRLTLGTLRSSTAKTYRSIVAKHLRPALEKIRSDALNRQQIQTWIEGLADQVQAGTMGPKTYNGIIGQLGAILTWARRQQYIAHNPLDGVRRLPRAKTERRFLQPREIDRLLAVAAKPPPSDTVLRLAAYSGLRRGELFALKWADVAWGDVKGDGGSLTVRRATYQGVEARPKTEGSARKVDVPSFVLADLRIYGVLYPPKDGDYIFRTATGSKIDPDNWRERVFRPIVTEAGLDGIGLHTLRHSYISILANQGEDLLYASRQAGHTSIKLTADIYGHLFEQTRREAMRRLEHEVAKRQKRVRSA
jgi:integrase